MLGWLVAALVVLGGLFYMMTGDANTLGSESSWDRWALILGGVMMGAYALLLLSDYRGRLSQGVKHFAVWLALGATLVIGYSFRDDLNAIANRVKGELVPPGYGVAVTGEQPGEIAVRIRRRGDSHFTARGEVNNTPMSFLVDTGASTVVLKPADAARAGIDTSRLSYTVAVQTANGTAYAAPVRLRSLSIGPIALADVEALVSKPGNLNENLLGMSFLRRLRSYEFSGDFMTLRK